MKRRNKFQLENQEIPNKTDIKMDMLNTVKGYDPETADQIERIIRNIYELDREYIEYIVDCFKGFSPEVPPKMDILEDKIGQSIKESLDEGPPPSFSSIDFKGFKRGEVNLVGAKTGVGKTMMVRDIITYLKDSDGGDEDG